MTDPKMRLVSPLWLGMIGLFGFTLVQTKSRGGFLGLMCGLAILFVSKYGLKRGIPLVILGAPILLLVAGGRQTEMSADVGTAAHRISLWDAGLNELVDTKFLGIGMNRYGEAAHGYVAHNSFVHAYVELGLIGGSFYAGMFYYLISTLWSMRKSEVHIEDPELRRIRPFVLAIVCAEAVGMLSISRCYIAMTYTLLGIGATYIDLARNYPGIEAPRVNGKWLKTLAVVGVGFFVIIYGYVKFKMRNE
jgi:O-antigen ligase